MDSENESLSSMRTRKDRLTNNNPPVRLTNNKHVPRRSVRGLGGVFECVVGDLGGLGCEELCGDEGGGC